MVGPAKVVTEDEDEEPDPDHPREEDEHRPHDVHEWIVSGQHAPYLSFVPASRRLERQLGRPSASHHRPDGMNDEDGGRLRRRADEPTNQWPVFPDPVRPPKDGDVESENERAKTR